MNSIVNGILYIMLLILSFFSCHVNSQSIEKGVSMGSSTRLIFHSNQKRISFPVKNETDYPLIFHGLVLTDDKSNYSPEFIISPEIVEVEPRKTKMVQVIRVGGNLTDDRESLFYLKGHFLPASSEGDDKGISLKVSYVMTMKMFFRPVRYKSSFDAIDDVAEDLDFKISNSNLIAINNSPYYFTLNTLSSEQLQIEIPKGHSFIEPYGQVNIPINDDKLKEITWTLINDGGFSTKSFTKKL